MDRTWTPSLVERRLIEAFRSLRGVGVYSPRYGDFRVVSGRRLSGVELIALTCQILARSSDERLALLTYARCQAGGATVADFCREFDWPRSTFEKRRRAAAAAVSGGINARRADRAA